MKPIIAIIGRPNVGKSTLFNRILGKKTAIVDDFPGVTRDRHYAEAEYGYREFILVDTGGFDPESQDEMLVLMREQVALALAEADALIFVVDGRVGLTPTDRTIWEQIRRSDHPSFLVVNKCDTPSLETQTAEFWTLGPDEIFPVTAERGTGVAELLDRVLEVMNPPEVEEGVVEEDGSGPVRIALIGRPNVGKSTLANAMLGSERYLTSDVPGTTVDAIDTPFSLNGRDYVLVDTAGVRRRGKVERGIERMSVARTMQALQRCHVALLLFDSAEGLTDQEKKLASLIILRGRGLVLVANKWDLVHTDGNEFEKAILDSIPFAAFAPMIRLSALTGRRVDKLLPVVDRVAAALFFRIGTSELNKFVEEVVRQHPPHLAGTKTVRIKYLSQVQVNPPVILVFCGGSGRIPPTYFRYLQRRLRERYVFEGVPLQLVQR